MIGGAVHLALWCWFHLLSVAPVQVARALRFARHLAVYVAGWAALVPVLLVLGADRVGRKFLAWWLRGRRR